MGFGLLAVLLGIWSVSAFDSEGTQFFWNYIRNGNPNVNLPNQTLSVTILNGANTSCTFTMQYRESYKAPLTTKSVPVPANSSAEMLVPAFYGFAYDTLNNPQTSSVPSVTLSANSTCPVTVLANNYDSVSGQGDTFMVLPVNWASNYFTFTLPPAILTTDPSPVQYQVVTFIPTQGVANVTLELVGSSGFLPTFTVDGSGAKTDYIALPTQDGLPRTYRISSNAPIQVVAGVTCVGVYGGSCDHVAFMPHPVPSFDCRSYEWVDDDHISDTISAGSFYIDIPSNCPIPQYVNATTSGTRSKIQTITLDPKEISTLQNFSSTSFGRVVGFHAIGSATHVTRFYDSSINRGTGAFISAVASTSSYINGPSYFYTRDANDTFEAICDAITCAAMRIDGTQLDSKQGDSITLDGITYYSFPYVVSNPGMHFVTFTSTASSNARYTYFVYGKTHGYGYGYLGSVNIPTLNILPTTLAPSTTSRPSTTSGSTTTSSSTSTTTTSSSFTSVPASTSSTQGQTTAYVQSTVSQPTTSTLSSTSTVPSSTSVATPQRTSISSTPSSASSTPHTAVTSPSIASTSTTTASIPTTTTQPSPTTTIKVTPLPVTTPKATSPSSTTSTVTTSEASTTPPPNLQPTTTQPSPTTTMKVTPLPVTTPEVTSPSSTTSMVTTSEASTTLPPDSQSTTTIQQTSITPSSSMSSTTSKTIPSTKTTPKTPTTTTQKSSKELVFLSSFVIILLSQLL